MPGNIFKKRIKGLSGNLEQTFRPFKREDEDKCHCCFSLTAEGSKDHSNYKWVTGIEYQSDTMLKNTLTQKNLIPFEMMWQVLCTMSL